MDEAGFAQLVEAGNQLFIAKLFACGSLILWIYDYILTLGDEVEYAWNGRRSWVFVLFIANRYGPVPYIIWSGAILFSYTEPLCVPTLCDLCRGSKWMGFTHATVVITLAEITIALRIYAVTERNKWAGGSLFIVIATQLAFGFYSIASAVTSPVEQLPEINLDPFKFCAYELSKLGELAFVNMGVAFDFLAFLIIFIAAKKPRYPGMPSILEAILRDATLYFVLMFTGQIIADMFIFFAPRWLSFAPGSANAVLVPLMASRLMLSLKKAAVGSTRAWSLSTMTSGRQGIATDGTIHFASQAPGGLQGVPAIPASPNLLESGVELDYVPRRSLNGELFVSS